LLVYWSFGPSMVRWCDLTWLATVENKEERTCLLEDKEGGLGQVGPQYSDEWGPPMTHLRVLHQPQISGDGSV
jgi:hypothetical protein